LRLYHSSGSPNSRRVRILIAEKGLDIELAPVDLGAKEQFSDAYRAINPQAVVPTLVLGDGTAIGEVPAIMRYLDTATRCDAKGEGTHHHVGTPRGA
jgi:glutathione S-transferase